MTGDRLLERLNILRDYLETMPRLTMGKEDMALRALANVEGILGFSERRKEGEDRRG